MAKKIGIDKLAGEVSEILYEYADTTAEGVKKAVRKTSKAVKEEIKAGAPVKTGDYQKSWAVKKIKENSNALVVTVHSKNRYQLAHLLEHGHAKRGGGRTRAISHIAPAESNGERMLEDEIKRSIKHG